MNKKKIPLSFVSHFPDSHPRAGEVTDFKAKILDGRKKHTVRMNLGAWILRCALVRKKAHYIDTRIWTGTPYGSPLDVEGMPNFYTIRVEPVFLAPSGTSFKVIGEDGLTIDRSVLAANDGLSEEDFTDWFMGSLTKSGDFYRKDIMIPLAIIHFTSLIYSESIHRHGLSTADKYNLTHSSSYDEYVNGWIDSQIQKGKEDGS